MRTLIAVIKITAYLTLTFSLIPVQAFLLKFCPKLNPFAFPRWYHRLCCKIFRIKVIVEGQIDEGDHVVYISNHVSYFDIPVIASVLRTAFVAKLDVANWPLFGTLGRLQKTFFISRNPRHAEREKGAFQARLDDPLPLVLFAEGTSTLGEKIVPFKSTLFEVFLNKNLRLQPMTLSILEVDRVKSSERDQKEIYAWGDVEIPEHMWRFAKMRGCTIKLKFQEPLSSHSYSDRKLLSNDCYMRVVEGLDQSSMAA